MPKKVTRPPHAVSANDVLDLARLWYIDLENEGKSRQTLLVYQRVVRSYADFAHAAIHQGGVFCLDQGFRPVAG